MSLSDTCFLVHDVASSNCAAWVQAWGSIVAIFASVGLVLWQQRLQKKRDRSAARSAHYARIETVFQLSAYAGAVALKASQEASGKPFVDQKFLSNILAELDSLITALSTYESKDFIEYKYLYPFMGVLSITHAVRRHCAVALEAGIARIENGPMLYNSLLHTPENLKALENKLRKLSDEIKPG